MVNILRYTGKVTVPSISRMYFTRIVIVLRLHATRSTYMLIGKVLYHVTLFPVEYSYSVLTSNLTFTFCKCYKHNDKAYV